MKLSYRARLRACADKILSADNMDPTVRAGLLLGVTLGFQLRKLRRCHDGRPNALSAYRLGHHLARYAANRACLLSPGAKALAFIVANDPKTGRFARAAGL